MTSKMPAIYSQHETLPLSRSADERLLRPLFARMTGYPEPVDLDLLLPADSPRLSGVDTAHAEALAEAGAEMPPILVDRSTMRVIDGMHRADAARLRGEDKILVQYCDCSDGEAFLLAVASNVRHGLPLTLADRRAAARRIVGLRPHASDRWIAAIAGLAPKTVATIRQDGSTAIPDLTHRIGRDGRVRPLNPAIGRRKASEIVAARPDASLRQIARAAGVSLGTARDVRNKMRLGIEPVPQRQRPAEAEDDGTVTSVDVADLASEPDFESVMQKLRQDPSVRYTEAGRTLIRWLHPGRLLKNSEWKEIADCVPSHHTFDMIKVARECAAAWNSFADELDRRNRQYG